MKFVVQNFFANNLFYSKFLSELYQYKASIIQYSKNKKQATKNFMCKENTICIKKTRQVFTD